MGMVFTSIFCSNGILISLIPHPEFSAIEYRLNHRKINF